MNIKDAWATKKYNKERVLELGIHYLEHDYLHLDGKLFFGSPYTPTFNDWHFNVSRTKLGRYWEDIHDEIDVLITHGPPKTILDLAYDKYRCLEYCGDGALLKRVLQKKPKIHCFGHIHNNSDCLNQGERIYNDIKFINASCVKDGEFLHLSSNGIIIDI